MINWGSGRRGWWVSRRQGWRSLRTLGAWLGLFSLSLGLVVGCLGNSPQAPPPAAPEVGPSRITIGTTHTVRTLDPADSYEFFDSILIHNLGDRLYAYAPGTTDLVPQLAAALPTVSADELTYTIPLRTDVTLHDGTPFDAEVMAFSIQRFIENGGKPAFLLGDRIAAVAATGPSELTITLKTPFAALPALLTFSGVTPLSPQSYEVGAGKFQPNTFVGSGPYKLASVSSDAVRLNVNEDYWGEKPANSGIDIQIFSSAANLYNSFKTDAVDVAYQDLDPEQITSLRQEADTGGWQVVEAGTNVINFLVLNQKIAPLNDQRVRQAIAAMIDRPFVNERVFQGQAEPLYSLIPTSFDVYEPVFREAHGDGNYEQARALLAAAGITPANPLNLEIWYPSASTLRGIVANTLKATIEAALPGLVTITVQTTEGPTLWGNISKGIYPSVLAMWYPDYYDADTYIQPFLSCDLGSTAALCQDGASRTMGSFYYNAAANALVAQQQAEQDPTARAAMLAELQQMVVADVPYIPLWQNKDYVFAQPAVQGVAIQPTQQFLFGPMSEG